MRILITGDQGFAGRHLRTALEDDGHVVVGLDARVGRDIRDYEAVRHAVSQVEPDQVYHLAALAWPRESVSDPRRAFEVNVTGTLNLLEAVRHTGCDAKVLLAGTSEEYGYEGRAEGEILTEQSACFPTTPYGASKLAATATGMAFAARYGLHVVCTRAWNHTGWGRQASNAESAFARRIVAVERGEADCVMHGDLSATRNLTDVRDVVAAYRAAIGCEPGIYNVCSSQTVTMAKVMGVLAARSILDKTPLKADPSLGRAEAGPFPEPSHAKLTAATGWEPAIPLEQTLRWLLDYWRSR